MNFEICRKCGSEKLKELETINGVKALECLNCQARKCVNVKLLRTGGE